MESDTTAPGAPVIIWGSDADSDRPATIEKAHADGSIDVPGGPSRIPFSSTRKPGCWCWATEEPAKTFDRPAKIEIRDDNSEPPAFDLSDVPLARSFKAQGEMPGIDDENLE